MSDHRHRPDRGSAIVMMLTLTFVFMSGAFIWLSRTVDHAVHDRSQAVAVAFQAARSGAQQVELNGASNGAAQVDETRAVAAVRATVAELLAGNGDTGEVIAVDVAGGRVTVTVAIITSGRRAVGTGTATAHTGFDTGEQ